MHSIRLISKDNNKQLKIDQDAIKHLQKIKESFGVCICVGPYRQGKSFLLNTISKKQNAFGVGHTDRSCTKGIMMLKNLIKIKDKNVLFLDTEGLESDDSDELWDSMLFLVSLLLSSLFIYNTKNTLTTDAFKKLAVITDICKNIKLSENQKTLKNDGPRFVWLVRDYSLVCTMSAEERLECFLKLEKGNLDDDSDTNKKREERNRLRTSLNENFKSLNCFYLPVPISDGVNGLTFEEAIHSLDKINFDQLRNVFKIAFNTFKREFENLIELKKINKNTINGPVFAEYLKQIVENLNKNKMIHLHEVISSSYDAVIQYVLDEMKRNYISKMDNLTSNHNLPIKKAEFDKQELTIYKNVIDFLNESFSFESDLNGKTLDLFNKFRLVKNYENDVIGGKLFTYYAINKKNIETKNNQIAIKYWNEEIKPMLEQNIKFTSITHFDQTLNSFRQKLHNELFECEKFDSFWNNFTSHINLTNIKSKLEFHFKDKELDEMKKLIYVNNPISNLSNFLKNFPSYWGASNEREPCLSIVSIKSHSNKNNCIQSNTSDDSKSPRTRLYKNNGELDLRIRENRKDFIGENGERLNMNGKPDLRCRENR